VAGRLVTAELANGRNDVPTLCSMSCRCSGWVFWSPGCGPFGADEVAGRGACKEASNDGSKDAGKDASRDSGEVSGKDADKGIINFSLDTATSALRCSLILSV
jgi:hypothetical protein